MDDTFSKLFTFPLSLDSLQDQFGDDEAKDTDSNSVSQPPEKAAALIDTSPLPGRESSGREDTTSAELLPTLPFISSHDNASSDDLPVLDCEPRVSTESTRVSVGPDDNMSVPEPHSTPTSPTSDDDPSSSLDQEQNDDDPFQWPALPAFEIPDDDDFELINADELLGHDSLLISENVTATDDRLDDAPKRISPGRKSYESRLDSTNDAPATRPQERKGTKVKVSGWTQGLQRALAWGGDKSRGTVASSSSPHRDRDSLPTTRPAPAPAPPSTSRTSSWSAPLDKARSGHDTTGSSSGNGNNNNNNNNNDLFTAAESRTLQGLLSETQKRNAQQMQTHLRAPLGSGGPHTPHNNNVCAVRSANAAAATQHRKTTPRPSAAAWGSVERGGRYAAARLHQVTAELGKHAAGLMPSLGQRNIRVAIGISIFVIFAIRWYFSDVATAEVDLELAMSDELMMEDYTVEERRDVLMAAAAMAHT